jgi:hypothetical protein
MIPTTGSLAIDNGASDYNTCIDPDSEFKNVVTTDIVDMACNEIGAFGFEGSPPQGGDTGLYLVIGGDKYLTHKGTKKLILSGE